MDWLTFVSDLVGILAWPVVVLIVLLVFRGPIFELGRRLIALLDERVEEASITREGLRLRRKVGEEIESAKEVLDSGGVHAELIETDSGFLDEMKELASINPAAAVAAASVRLEVALRDVLSHDPDSRPMSLGLLVREATQKGLLTSKEGEVAQSLGRIRADALHLNVATEAQALEFAQLARQVAIAARLADGEFGQEGKEPL
ncbi:hypothetical protein [Mycobacteroides abscessus]|uniref:hypothetical protein n=1 Tax=Mycobacteroides abscessus TaxID=36809 RepID=UPI000C25826F|nr:hypothetical protein [Mycobacteroides abscessus]